MSAAGSVERLKVSLAGKHWPDGRPVLGALQFSVAAGEVLAISGPSGCGKSTLLSILAGLDRQFGGLVEWRGSPRIGVVFQTPRLLPWRTAIENVALGLAGRKEAKRRAGAALAEVGLAEAADVYPSRLSLGMARRVAFARALLAEPDVLLLDEAFVSLDAEVANKLRSSVMARVTGRAMTVVMITHDLRDSAEMAGRLLTLGGTPARLVDERALPPAPAERQSPRPTVARSGPSVARGFFRP